MAELAGEAPTVANGGVSSLLAGMRTRVLVSFLVLLLLSTAASVLVLRAVLLSRIGDEAQEALTAQVDRFRELAQSRAESAELNTLGPNKELRQLFDDFLGGAVPAEDGALVTFIRGNQHEVRSVVSPESGLVEALQPLASVNEPLSGEVETPAGRARYVSVPVLAGDTQRGALVAARLLSGERAEVEDAVQVAIGVSVVVLGLASLFIWLAAGRAVAPLHALSRTARAITETDLSRRIPVRGNDEIAELGRTFNGMLDRLEIAFANQKEFVADISHELRTPITVIRGHLETLGDDPRERREAAAVIADELSRMSRLVDDLLLLIRAPRPDFLRPEPIDIDLLTQDVLGKARSLGDRRWRLDGTGIGLLRADPQRLTQAIMNLAEHAVRHTTDGEVIAVGSALRGGEARLWVRDEGPGIPPADQQRIFERFARAAGELRGGAVGGAGLGLAIVKAIAEAHGGRVELDSRPGFGATFTIVVPAEPAAESRRPVPVAG